MTTQHDQPSLSEFTPLGLPKGSVRALASLIVVMTAWIIILLGEYPHLTAEEAEFTNVVILVVSFYFGVRRTAVGMTGGEPVTRADPLYLPRTTIRIIMLLGFSATIIYVAWDAESWTEIPPFLFTTFLIIIGYFAGIVLNEIIERYFAGDEIETGLDKAIKHLKALALLFFTLLICGLYIWGVLEDESVPDYFGNLLAVAIGLYYGSRS
ncbi:MAG: hypothetical protein ACFFB3_04970 [Candidatus Hodarchaeota archaeon]